MEASIIVRARYLGSFAGEPRVAAHWDEKFATYCGLRTWKTRKNCTLGLRKTVMIPPRCLDLNLLRRKPSKKDCSASHERRGCVRRVSRGVPGVVTEYYAGGAGEVEAESGCCDEP